MVEMMGEDEVFMIRTMRDDERREDEGGGGR